MGGAGACTNGESSAPLGKGDHLIVDVEASTLPPQPDAYVPPDSTFAEVDGSTALRARIRRVGPARSFAARRTGPRAQTTRGPAGGAAAERLPAAPGGLRQPADCECLLGLAAIATQLPCTYPHCSVGMGFNLYCPP